MTCSQTAWEATCLSPACGRGEACKDLHSDLNKMSVTGLAHNGHASLHLQARVRKMSRKALTCP